MNREQRRRERLYTTFKSSLTGGAPLPVYDENELIDIFDYAADNGDDYVKMEVMLFAARLYPESEDMLQRRAYFMYDNLSMTEGALVMSRAHRDDSPLWAVLDLLVRHPSSEECIATMDSLLEHYGEFDDETTIQLVDACSDLDIFQWVVDHKKELLDKCAFPETLIYEMAMEADAQSNFKLSAELMEELTERDPFNAVYWHLLAQLRVKLDEYEEALAAIDYALAINGSDSNYKLTKAQVLYDMQRDMDLARTIAKDIVAAEPDNTLALHTLAAMYGFDNMPMKAFELLKAYITRNPNDKEAVEHTLMVAPQDNVRSLIEDYLTAASPTVTSDDITAWARVFYGRDNILVTSELLLYLLERDGNISEWELLLESLYRRADYQRIAKLYVDAKASETSGLDLSMTGVLVIVLSLLRVGLDSLAKQLTELVMQVEISEILPFEKRLTVMGVQSVLLSIRAAMSPGNPIDYNQFDPFIRPVKA